MQGYIDLFYYDESRFGLTPCVPYAWQAKGEAIELPSARGGHVNVAGFFSKGNVLAAHCSEATVNGERLAGIFNDFAQKTTKMTVVVLDNAPVHKSRAFMGNVERWRRENDLHLYFLPTYSPELNAIEILWRKIKYEWLDFSAYLSFDMLKTNLRSVLEKVGKEFNIQFV